MEALAWPAAITIIVIAAQIIFQKPIGGLIGRVHKVKLPGGFHADASLPVQIGGQLSYVTAATLPQGCSPRPQPGSLIFRGSSEALARLQLFANGQRAALRSCMEGRSQVLVLAGGKDAKLATANNFLRAYNEGKLPDVEVGFVGW